MNRAIVVTPYHGSGGASDPYRAALGDDYAVPYWEDATQQVTVQILPSPNAYTVAVRCDDATLAAIQADPAYVVLTAVSA